MAKDSAAPSKAKMKRKDYENELRKLQVELCHLQDWLKAAGARVIVVFEGRDAAGKGGTIKAITERVSPRIFQVVALPAPSDREKTQMYVQRYIERFPAAGEIVILTGVGTIVPALKTLWDLPAPRTLNASSRSARNSKNTSSMPASF
jgi:polyphosphate kinase 2 (PPK2 family)